jgi:lysophospholipase L1-like esterase
VADGSREISRWWARTHRINVDAASSKTDIDVLFLGDSITEGWRGTSRGHDIARAQGAQQVFTKHFEGGGSEAKYEGLALGIAGDTSTNLLWRIQNGELPDTLNPKVIWLLIGTNDFGNAWCSPELVLIGIIRVVEELRLRKPAATIVINGLLPRSFHRKGYVMRGRPSLFGRAPRLPSLWRDIVSVNEELRQYSLSRDKVEYFETNLFFVDKKAPREQLKINSHLMPDRLHPSADGYDLWAEQIVATLEELIVNR